MTIRIERWGDRLRDGMRHAMLDSLRLRGRLFAALMDSRSASDPYPLYRQVRERGVCVRTPLGAMTVDHRTVDAVLRDPGTRTAVHARELAREGTALERLLFRGPDVDCVEPIGSESLIGLDGERHARLRRLASAVFTRNAIESFRPRLESLAGECLDRALDARSCELMETVARPYPVAVIGEILGIPSRDHERIATWGIALAIALETSATSAQLRVSGHATEALNAYLAELLEARRRHPRDDLFSAMATVEADGAMFTDREILATAMLLLVAGFETTVNLIGNATLALAESPEQTAWLREDPATRARQAIEELLRFDTPVQLTYRFTGSPIETDRGILPAGTRILLLLGGANRDPAVFEHPERLDLARANARRHLAFASGPHHCLGAALARLEGEVYLRALVERLDEIRLTEAPRRRPSRLLRGLESLCIAGRPIARNREIRR